MTPDAPYELPGGRVPEFGEYAALILHELRRLTDGQTEMAKSIQELLQNNGLINQRMDELAKHWEREFTRHVAEFERFQEQVKKDFDQRDTSITTERDRVDKLVGREQMNLANLSGKKWVIGIIFIVLTAIVVPVINTIQALKGG